MGWADKLRRLQIRTNADQPDQVANAVAFGAQGVGLCRTEHMFFEGDRIDAVREMILATTQEARQTAVNKLLPYQKKDFAGIFRSLNGLPATIRFLDPPLHEFLPQTTEQQSELAHKLGVSAETGGASRGRPARVQPHARPSRLPPGHRLSRDLGHAGPRDLRGGHRGAEGRHQGAPGDHDPAGRFPQGARFAGRAGAQASRRR